MASGLDALSPGARTQYEALIPEIERSVRSSNQARGTFYSGQATDAEARAKADLLAKLAAQDTALQATAAENAKNRSSQAELAAQEIKAAKRNSLVNLIGTGVGSAATLGGMAMMNKPGLQFLPDGKGGMLQYDPSTKTFSPLDMSGGRGAVGFPATAPSLAAPAPGANIFDPNAGLNFAPENPAANLGPMVSPAVPGTAPAITPTMPKAPTMWQNASDFSNLGAGAVGGGAGYLAAKGLGAKGTNAAIGSGAGGLGAYLAYAKYGGGNPLMAGLSALGGSFGGGLLGNLFK